VEKEGRRNPRQDQKGHDYDGKTSGVLTTYLLNTALERNLEGVIAENCRITSLTACVVELPGYFITLRH
jgi:hypothetical protein